MLPSLQQEIERTSTWLASPEARAMLDDDPYWPKWEGPWWAMTLLWELGRAGDIPADAARAMVAALNRHYERSFPASEVEALPGKNLWRDYPCFCMAGTIMQVLHGAGVAVDEASPWLREFLLAYRLGDGGWNCDNGKTAHSSFLSTCVAAEALLNSTARDFTPEEAAAVDSAAEYFLRRSLCRSLSKGSVADESWLTPHFPRFYDYDTLRGLTYLARWSERRERPLEAAAIGDAAAGVDRFFAEGLPVYRAHLEGRSFRRDAAGEWTRQEKRTTPLLDLTAGAPVGRARLLAEWAATRAILLRRAGSR